MHKTSHCSSPCERSPADLDNCAVRFDRQRVHCTLSLSSHFHPLPSSSSSSTSTATKWTLTVCDDRFLLTCANTRGGRRQNLYRLQASLVSPLHRTPSKHLRILTSSSTSFPLTPTLTTATGGEKASSMRTTALRPKAKSRRHTTTATTTHGHRPAVSISSSRSSLVLALVLSCALLSPLPTAQASSLSSRSEDAWDAPRDPELRRERYPYRYGRQRERERWRRTDVPAAGYFDPNDYGGSMLTVRLPSLFPLSCAADEAFSPWI